jgi:hypothetical protein
MRRRVDAGRIEALMTALGEVARRPARVYFTGGVTAVLLGWRTSTLDVDYRVEPDDGDILGRIPALKEKLELNLEPASPQDFIPELPGWRDRATFIRQAGTVSFFHYDFVAQALAKIERGHSQDLVDVRELVARRLVSPDDLRQGFAQIERALESDHRYSALDAATFRKALESFLEPRGRLPEDG